jgi:hypothetical protein
MAVRMLRTASSIGSEALLRWVAAVGQSRKYNARLMRARQSIYIRQPRVLEPPTHGNRRQFDLHVAR